MVNTGPPPENHAADEEEIVRLYEEHAPGMLRYALALASCRQAAEDSLQEAFLRFFVARRQGQRIQIPRAWLYSVLRNHMLDQLRASSLRNEVPVDSVSGSPDLQLDIETQYCRSETLSASLLSALSPRESECVRLRAEGLHYEEIANILGVSCGTVGALMTRAHKKLRRARSGDGVQPAGTKLRLAGGSPDAR